MNSYPGQGQNPRAMVNEDMRPARMPSQEVDRGAISLTIQLLRDEISQLNEEISLLSERLAPICAGRPVGTNVSEREEKQGPASKHAEELRELQAMVHSCRVRINVIVGQLDL